MRKNPSSSYLDEKGSKSGAVVQILDADSSLEAMRAPAYLVDDIGQLLHHPEPRSSIF